MAQIYDLFKKRLIEPDTLVSTGDAHAERGLELFEAGSYRLAAEAFMQAITAGTAEYESSELYGMFGISLVKIGSHDHAIELLGQAVELDPGYSRAWQYLGLVHFDQGDLGRARDCFEQAVSGRPDYAEAHASLGVIEIEENRPGEAIERLEEAIELNHYVVNAHGNLALAYAMAGRFVDAYAKLKHSIALGYEYWRDKKRKIDNLRALSEM